ERDLRSLQRGDPVAIIGYPLGFDLPMRGEGMYAVAEPTLTVGTASKVLPGVVQVDGYGAPGSSGSPIFNREGRVVAVLYGGERAEVRPALPGPRLGIDAHDPHPPSPFPRPRPNARFSQRFLEDVAWPHAVRPADVVVHNGDAHGAPNARGLATHHVEHAV